MAVSPGLIFGILWYGTSCSILFWAFSCTLNYWVVLKFRPELGNNNSSLTTSKTFVFADVSILRAYMANIGVKFKNLKFLTVFSIVFTENVIMSSSIRMTILGI